MAEDRAGGALEVAQDLEFQRREWAAQRVAWVLVILLLLAGGLGVAGSGLLSGASVVQGPLRIDFHRFERKHRPTELRVEVAGGATRQGQLQLWLDNRYLAGITIHAINPEPDQAQAGADRTVYHFPVDDPSQPAGVTFELESETVGPRRLRVGLVDGPEVAASQFFYP